MHCTSWCNATAQTYTTAHDVRNGWSPGGEGRERRGEGGREERRGEGSEGGRRVEEKRGEGREGTVRQWRVWG